LFFSIHFSLLQYINVWGLSLFQKISALSVSLFIVLRSDYRPTQPLKLMHFNAYTITFFYISIPLIPYFYGSLHNR
jgi:hypothetical protein